MALMDYKISSMVQNGSTTVVNLRYYVGAITTEDEYDFDSDANVAVTRYRRTGHASVSGAETMTKSGTVELADFIEDLNTALASKAAAAGHTPIDEQTND
jgi:hypothetical protein